MAGTVLVAELEMPVAADPGTVTRDLAELDLAAGTGPLAFEVVPPEAGISCYHHVEFDPILGADA